MILNENIKGSMYLMEIHQHTYIDNCLYGIVKCNNVPVLTVTFKEMYYPLISEICKGKQRKLLMRNYKNSTIKDLCKLRIRVKKPIRLYNFI